MKPFAIYVDSAANIPNDIRIARDIRVISFNYIVNGEEHPCFTEDMPFEETAKQFYDAMRAGAEAKTSLLPAAAFEEALTPALEEGRDVLLFTLSSGVSGTFAQAQEAGKRLAARFPDRKVFVLDSANASFYTSRLDSLNRVISRTDSIVRQLLAGSGQRAFLIYHPALSYFARDYGLTQLCLEEGGKEPSPAHLKQLIATCRAKGVRTIFVQKEFDSRNAELAAKEIGAKLVVINPLNYHWDEELVRTAEQLAIDN